MLWRSAWTGKLPATNRWHGATCIGGKGRIYLTPEYRKLRDAMAMSFRVSAANFQTIDYPVDLTLEVSLWRVRDSDSPVKAILDALELGQILKDDKLVRDILIARKYHKRDEQDEVRVWIYSTGPRAWDPEKHDEIRR